MKPEQVTDFKRELASLSGTTWEPEDLRGWLEDLFKRYDLPTTTIPGFERKRRRCTTPPVPIYSSSGSGLIASGHKTYTGNTAYLLSSSSKDMGWCPMLNVLLLRSESWTEEDTYLRIPGGRSLYIEQVSVWEMTDQLYSGRMQIVWMDDELRGADGTLSADSPDSHQTINEEGRR